MAYLFDTDVLSNTMKRAPSGQLLRRLALKPPNEQFTTTITVAKMTYGAVRSSRASEILARLAADVWPNLQILSFDMASAETYGRLRAELERVGTPIAEPDLRIAAIALSHGHTLVTGNGRHLSRVPDLIVEDWMS